MKNIGVNQVSRDKTAVDSPRDTEMAERLQRGMGKKSRGVKGMAGSLA